MTRDELIVKIENAAESEKDFQEIIAAVLDDGFMTARDLTDEFDCPLSTSERWRTGKSAPGPAIRQVVYEFLLEELQKATP